MKHGHTHLVDHALLRAVYMIDPEAIRQATVCSDGKWHVLPHSDAPYGNYGIDTKKIDSLPDVPPACKFDVKNRLEKRRLIFSADAIRLLLADIPQILAKDVTINGGGNV